MFGFGEKVAGYEIRVFNEREVRAAAGIVFLFAFIAFMNGFLTGNNAPTKLMVSVFLLDFFIRLFINPKYAPSMVVGRWIVNNQTPEYVGAPQKMWAWGFGFFLAALMFYLVVLNDIRGPVNILTCALCLGLLFFEAVFGICAGCKVYHAFHQGGAKHCPGHSCDLTKKKASIQSLNFAQKTIFTLSILALFYLVLGDIVYLLITG
ncbi:DUF4395 domain-containing protein [bacterium endosymbiont of Bathymodiolus sp. 5 South]|jgi:hypothetical protein|uniref:DUF4395 domain-containing protein n=1 Tax=bacterium endosymbiont of Bathymodiolus sp. 5 South TaxID=1181670 RepID=UPI000255FE3A|nr:DUF4395 domain-containing protein [bacterium endosymbiont of Bathymodiolus sp. 5 South]CAC9443013.1 hypothetical protein [uncultured Gammaproteobacteria bacterium]CAC9449873.1 hypothetical protein [uncultured Gammaproteobacteria bacterium]CAC9452269.1 hypothetical protein [uncultured Gammaproteobacteria bacterium]CAC9460969.1 hypothetical protein [uncultured Gammaproteobacteria bacterium]SHN90814.1 hypothetical protein BCLUESOX_1037 [bacterium endosymbiont of Bathymodiolus sp. 5 South]